MTPTRCLVLGGGLLGSHTAVELAAAGHAVTVYSRSFSPWLRLHRPAAGSLELVEGDVPSPGGLVALVADAEVVFPLLGSSTPAYADRDPMAGLTAALSPVLSVLDAMRAAGTRRVVVASSGGQVYGRVEVLPTPESHPLSPVSLHGAHAQSLEAYTHFYAREHDLEPTVLRFSNAYGPGQESRRGQGVVAAWCRALALGEPATLIGAGTVRRDFLYARDAATAALAAAFSASGTGTYNVGGGGSHSLDEVLSTLEEGSGRRLDIQPSHPRPFDVPVTELDTTLLHERTGWKPQTSLAEGLAATWEWELAHAAGRSGKPASP